MASIEHVKKYKHDKYMPENLIHDILSWATVKDLGRWKSVSKAWLELISSPEFVLNHCEKSKVSLILETCCRTYNEYLIIDGLSRTLEKPLDPSRDWYAGIRIMGSCNGLICFLIKDFCGRETVFIFNPITEKSFSLPVDDGIITLHWFGRGPSSISRDLDQETYVGMNQETYVGMKVGKLKLVVGTKKPQFHWDDPLIFREGYVAPFDDMGISLHNFIHWRVTVRLRHEYHFSKRIFRYHLESKKMDCISFPDACRCYTLGVLHESLITLLKKNDIFELWIMKEYGVGKSWTKHHIFQGFDEYRYLYPLGFSADGCLFVRAISVDFSMDKYVLRTRENKIAKYDFTRETITDLHQGSSISIWIMFSGSLVG